ncbi:hypothetical protein GCM10010435_48140 [Winogradskya consettensis]
MNADPPRVTDYAYYGSKDGLFDAVFDAVVVQTLSDVPLDVEDLPEYAARLYDQHLVTVVLALSRSGVTEGLDDASAAAAHREVIKGSIAALTSTYSRRWPSS